MGVEDQFSINPVNPPYPSKGRAVSLRTQMQHEITNEMICAGLQAATRVRLGAGDDRAQMAAALEAVAGRLRAQGMQLSAKVLRVADPIKFGAAADAIDVYAAELEKTTP